jgi:predicted O-linked N-acetylglucosamine transferase (SPINDLY family)
VSGPELAEAWRLHRAGEHEQAERLYRKILDANPSNYEARYRLAFLHGQRGRWADAESVMARAIALNPHAADALFLRGSALQKLHRHDEAIACFDRALALNPALAEVRLNRAASLYRLRRYEDAGDDYSRLLDIAPDYPFARGNRLFCRLQCCDWRSLQSETATIVAEVRAGRRVIAPFDAKSLFFAAEHDLACARIWAADQYAGPTTPLSPRGRRAHSALRVAYASADFRAGPLASLMTGVFERHDRRRVESIGVSLGPGDGSAIRHRFERAFGRFVDASVKGDAEIVSLLRQMEVDIAVDLMGYTEGGRAEIFRQRVSPIQIGYLGYPGTIGGGWLDYLIADRVVVPEDQQRFYAEQIVYLPDTFLPRDTAVGASSAPVTRAEEGLPEQGFVFACFNNAYKINPLMFDVWMRHLRAVDGSVLWLPEGNRASARNLAHEARARGVDPDRLIFAPFRKSPERHLARLRLANLFLDTLPYNAHTTASDALFAGLPVLTCLGQTFSGRVAASLLQSLAIPELITRSMDEYETAALRFAREPGALKEIREKLERHRTTHATFDEARFAANLETAYFMIWDRHQRGERPASFAVER